MIIGINNPFSFRKKDAEIIKKIQISNRKTLIPSNKNPDKTPAEKKKKITTKGFRKNEKGRCSLKMLIRNK
jgi:hypothetical protein